jgi:hypothetical protein
MYSVTPEWLISKERYYRGWALEILDWQRKDNHENLR